MINSTTLARLGFDAQRFRFAVRTAIAACIALFVGWALGFEHPQWAAMSVFAASQPARNMLLEKAFFRGVGTVVGTGFGVALMFASGGSPAVLVVGLALWISLCALFGNVLRGLVSYGALQAGFSAALVTLLETGHPDQVLLLGADRLLTVMTGIGTAMVMAMLFTPRGADDQVVGRTRHLTAVILQRMAAHLNDGLSGPPAAPDDLLREAALIEEGLDPHGAGSLRSRRSARTLRSVIAAQLSALVWLRTTRPGRSVAAADALLDAARLVEAAAPPADVIAAMTTARALTTADPELHDVIGQLEAALRERLGVSDDSAPRRVRGPRVILHRDWKAARQAALRTGGVLLLLGGVWLLTGWHAGAYLMLSTAVMITLFSTWEDPAWIMAQVLVGQMFGALGALICRWLVWPYAQTEIMLVVMLVPFIFLGALPLAHRRTMFGATDYFMILLLLSHPALPLSDSFGESLSLALAVVAGPLIALASFRLVFPVDARRRMRMLIHAMVHGLEVMAAEPEARHRAEAWRARLRHRMLRLVLLAQKSGETRFSAEEGGQAVLVVGSAILRLHELRIDPDLPKDMARAADVALGGLKTLSRRPDHTAAALDSVAQRLAAAPPSGPIDMDAINLVSAASVAIRANSAFFAIAAETA